MRNFVCTYKGYLALPGLSGAKRFTAMSLSTKLTVMSRFIKEDRKDQLFILESI